MNEVKWIKLYTDVFNHRKIKLIEALPDGDSIIVIWLKLLCLAGEVNQDGSIMFAKDIAYTDEMLAAIFSRPLNITRLALKTFQQFHMIEIIDEIIQVTNWSKYQNIESLDRIREQNRLRVAKYRLNKQAVKEISESNVTRNDTVTCGNAERLIELDLELEEDKDIKAKESTASKKPPKHPHGQFANVMLTDNEEQKLKAKLGDSGFYEALDELSIYLESTGKRYRSHYATILNWVRRDAKRNLGRRKPIIEAVPDYSNEVVPEISEAEKQAILKNFRELTK